MNSKLSRLSEGKIGGFSLVSASPKSAKNAQPGRNRRAIILFLTGLMPHGGAMLCRSPKSASPLQCALAKKCLPKPRAIRTCKIIGLKPSWNEQLQKYRGVPPPCQTGERSFLLPCILASLLPASRSFRVREHSSVGRLCGGRGGVKRENAETSVPGNHFLGGAGDGIPDDERRPRGAGPRASAFDGDLAVRDCGGGVAPGRAGWSGGARARGGNGPRRPGGRNPQKRERKPPKYPHPLNLFFRLFLLKKKNNST